MAQPNIPPELLALILKGNQGLLSNTAGDRNIANSIATANYADPWGGNIHNAFNVTSLGQGEDANMNYNQTADVTALSKDVVEGNREAGDSYYRYGLDGNYQGTKQYNDFAMKDFLTGLAMMAGPFAAAIGGVPAAGAAAGGAGGTGTAATAAAAGDAFLPGALAANGGAAVPWGAALPGISGIQPLGAGLAAFNPAMDSQAANMAMGSDALSGYVGTGGVTGSPVGGSWLSSLGDKASSLFGGGAGGGGTGTGLLGSLTGGSGSSLLGLASTALGGLAGGQGQSADQSSTRRMDPRLDQPVFGDLIPRTQSLLAQQMAPDRMAGYRKMQQQGMGMLDQPVAGNGFARFYGA